MYNYGFNSTFFTTITIPLQVHKQLHTNDGKLSCLHSIPLTHEPEKSMQHAMV